MKPDKLEEFFSRAYINQASPHALRVMNDVYGLAVLLRDAPLELTEFDTTVKTICDLMSLLIANFNKGDA